MGNDENDVVNNEEESETNDDQIQKVYDVLFEAIPDGICSFNVLVAINQLSLDWALTLHEECHGYADDEDDEQPYGNLPGTPFSKN